MKKLDRELGLFEVFSISSGAMIGSGIFVLPALAVSIGGPSVFFAYALAGFIVLPAALSKAEMATAMPESGGTYLFLDRSLGPLAGTVTGIGTWISLMLKSSFALVGLSAYLLLFGPLSPSMAKYIGVAIAVGLIVMNCYGAKLTGRLQALLVVFTIAVLLFLVGKGSLHVQQENFADVFPYGFPGFLSATAFIFVSYAGVTKVASTAEEIRDPGRNIPWGIMLSMVTMMLLYTLVAYMIVGVVPIEELLLGKNRLTPVALVGNKIMGPFGLFLMAGTAVLALSSMANAGLLSSSRYPLAMARDKHLPEFFKEVHPKRGTPVRAILVTGGLIIACIILLPVKELAKLASAFKLLVFFLVNIALIVFRESEIEWYSPEFLSPWYPYVQILGAGTTLGLLGIMGWYDVFPLLGATAVVGLCLVWYLVYARGRIERSGALFRTTTDAEEIKMFQRARNRGSSRTTDKDSVIVPFFGLEKIDMIQVERRIRIAAALCEGVQRLDLVDFVEVPEQSFLSDFEADPDQFEALERRAKLIGNTIANEIHVDQVITHNARGALKNYAEEENPHWVVFGWKEPSPWQILIGASKWWLEDFPCDRLFFRDRGREELENILVWTHPGPYDGEVVYAADHIARYERGGVTFLQPIVPGDNRGFPLDESYIKELQSLCNAPSSSLRIPMDDWVDEVLEATEEADLLVLGGLHHQAFEELKFEELEKQIVERAHCSVARVESNLRSPQSVRKRHQPLSIELSDYLQEDPAVLDGSLADKDRLFEKLSELMSTGSVTPRALETSFWEREEKQNTFLEKGFAFPHAITDQLAKTRCRILVLEEPVAYTAEGDEVRYLVVTTGPPQDRQTHLEIMGALADLLISTSVYESEKPVETIKQRLKRYVDRE